MKKSLLFTGAALLLVAVLLCMAAFSLDVIKVGGGEVGGETTVDMTGTWRLVVHKTTSGVETDLGYLILEDTGNARIERGSGDDVTVSDHTWSVSEGKLNVDGAGSFILDVKTADYVHLYEAQDCYYGAVRCFDRDIASAEPQGTWNVTFHQGQAITDEYIEFENNTLSDYRDNQAAPALVTSYHMTGSDRMFVDELYQDVLIRMSSDNLLFLVETESGRVWELLRVKE